MIEVKKELERRVCQGDIIKNLEYIEDAVESEGVFDISKITFPYSIVLTQDCDLEQDFVNRKNHYIFILVDSIENVINFNKDTFYIELCKEKILKYKILDCERQTIEDSFTFDELPCIESIKDDMELQNQKKIILEKILLKHTKNPMNNDKHLISVIVAPLYNYDHFCLGQHLSELNLKMQIFSSEKKKDLKNNQLPRYHYLEFRPSDEMNMPPSVIDFKHYFSVNITALSHMKNKQFICKVSPLYRELISQRFANFLSRIGLP